MADRATGTTVPHEPGPAPQPVRGAATPEPAARPGGRWVALLALAPLTLLTAASWSGRWVRPSGDEWCFLPVVRDGGISALVDTFYAKDNGRIVNALLVGAYATFDVPGHQWFPLVSGVLMLGILWAVTAAALRRAALTAPAGTAPLVAAVVTALFLFASRNTYKTFFWPAASVSHTLPPVLACAAALPLLRARTRTGRRLALGTVLVAGVVMAMLSEETTVVAVLVLAAAWLLAERIAGERMRPFLRRWCVAGLAGCLIGGVLLYTSPGLRIRRERHDAGTAEMVAPDSLLGALEGFARILGMLLTNWPYLAAVAVGTLLALLTRPTGDGPPRPPRGAAPLAAAGGVVFLLSGYLCTLLAYPVFGGHVTSSTRIWNDFVLLYLVLLVGAGTLLGRAVRRRAARTGPPLAVAAALCGVVCAALLVSVAHLDTAMRARAQAWERQDRSLRAEAAAGARTVPYTPLVIAEMTEPFDKRGTPRWSAACVADYYRVDHVTLGTRRP
ncbi:DUF6056 family protein [Streptomyces benahoarensis]|uniref:Uncharacterized protein n=1 Tax=Streptomyces benahoarensis TaxID=2595054 RepID=A0A553ZCM6_9ACTN|nr:DUF6056 family protein [Streptomyces benahoarensis]TSB21083.1 hypothetical protein FNJ62_20060 [Streptomyces benahoarensis]TSB39202.1 hypothetical protein FNZ23_15675 [Streptomyces benahoarensis]